MPRSQVSASGLVWVMKALTCPVGLLQLLGHLKQHASEADGHLLEELEGGKSLQDYMLD